MPPKRIFFLSREKSARNLVGDLQFYKLGIRINEASEDAILTVKPTFYQSDRGNKI
jgi:hypothetical protein